MRAATDEVREHVDRTLHRALTDLGAPFERPDSGAYLVTLPGEGRTAQVWLLVGARALQVECFFLRRPEQNALAVVSTLMARNVRSYGVHFALDTLGDVYLVGQVPFAAVDADEVDRLLGQVVTHLDEAFAVCVQHGFGDRVPAKVLDDGAGRRIEGTPDSEPHADPRR